MLVNVQVNALLPWGGEVVGITWHGLTLNLQ